METEYYLYIICGVIGFAIFNIVFFKLSMAEAFMLYIIVCVLIGAVSFLITERPEEKNKQEKDVKVTLVDVPYQEIEMEKVQLLTEEEQEKDGVDNESFLFVPKEDGQEIHYIEIAFQEQLKQIIHRFPAYVEYEDVQKAQIRYQLIGNDVYNAVVTLPIVMNKEAE